MQCRRIQSTDEQPYIAGRLYEKCLELLQGADIQFKRAHRLDVALVQNHPIALVFLPAADIPRFVGEGNVDLGITGQDMVAEAGETVSRLVAEELQLGFGKCQLQVQAPESTVSIKSAEDLVGKKVATSFDYLAGKYFADLDAKVNQGKAEGEKVKTDIEYVGGSVETACALGLADGIGECGMAGKRGGRDGVLTLAHRQSTWSSLARRCVHVACTRSAHYSPHRPCSSDPQRRTNAPTWR